MTEPPVAVLDQVSVDYPLGDTAVPALVDACLTIAPASSIALLGRSGSGKSTLVSVLALLRRPTRGSVTVDGRAIGTLNDAGLSALRSRCVGTVFQSFHLDPSFSALDNVMLPWFFRSRGGRSAATARAAELLGLVGVGELAKRTPSQMSGGQRQRVAIARALYNEPLLVVADEPTGNLDDETATAVADVLFALPTQTGTAVVVVTHDDQVARRADATVRITQGRLELITSAPERLVVGR